MELVLFETYILLVRLPTTAAFTGSDVSLARHVIEYTRIITLKSVGGAVVARGSHITSVSVLGSLLRGFIVHYSNS